MIDEATLYNILDTVSILTALTFFLLWSERHNLRGWQQALGNLAWVAYCLGSLVRILLMVLA